MLSIPHLIIIFVVALVVFGPEKLPELARNVGKFMVEFRRITGEFKGTLDDHLRDLEREGNARRAAAESAERAKKEAELNAAAQASALGAGGLATSESATAVPEAAGSAPALPEPPTVTRAEGIVPSADPRVVKDSEPSEPASHEQNAQSSESAANSSENTSDSNRDADRAPSDPNSGAATVTHGEHSAQ